MTADEAAHSDPEAFALYRTAPHVAVCPSGERLTDGQERIVAALHLIGRRHPGETVAAVTHAVTIRLVVAKLPVIAGSMFLLIGQQVFEKARQRSYQLGLTALIVSFGAILVGTA
jgi:broad specificity phosphatase PhoE